jgi:hypothetical protein
MLCWDMAIDRTHWKDAAWLPVTAITSPIVMWVCYGLWGKYCPRKKVKNLTIGNKLSIYDRQSKVNTESNRTLSYNVELPDFDNESCEIVNSLPRNSYADMSNVKYENEVISPLNTVIL